MICQNCLKNAASVHVTEIGPSPVKDGAPKAGTPTETTPEEGTPKAGAPKDGALKDDGAKDGGTTPNVREQHLCEACAQTLDLPHSPGGPKVQIDIWKLLQATAQQTRRKGGPTCQACGLGLEEFRRKGRLGCPACYQAFASHLGELLERVHGARTHVGRLPGSDPMRLARERQLTDLRQKLETAIREEAYENAARLRDELRQIEGSDPA